MSQKARRRPNEKPFSNLYFQALLGCSVTGEHGPIRIPGEEMLVLEALVLADGEWVAVNRLNRSRKDKYYSAVSRLRDRLGDKSNVLIPPGSGKKSYRIDLDESGAESDVRDFRKRFDEGVAAFEARDWAAARDAFWSAEKTWTKPPGSEASLAADGVFSAEKREHLLRIRWDARDQWAKAQLALLGEAGQKDPYGRP